jgi:hypothetical protein
MFTVSFSEPHVDAQRAQRARCCSISAHVRASISPSRCRENRATMSGHPAAGAGGAGASIGWSCARRAARARCSRLFTAATLIPTTSEVSAAVRPSTSRRASTSRSSGSRRNSASSRCSPSSRAAAICSGPRRGSGMAAAPSPSRPSRDTWEPAYRLRRRFLMQWLRAIA